MSPANSYRAKTAELNAKACNETNERMQKEWAALAQAYLRLAEQADRNAQSDVIYEPAWITRRGGFEGDPA